MGKAVAESRIRPTSGDESQAVSTANDIMKRMRGKRPARDLYASSESARTHSLGSTSSAADVERGFATDARTRIGSAVPSSAEAMGKMNDLSPVLEAFSGSPKGIIDTRRLPFILGQMAGLTNRALNPATQGLYTAGQAMDSDLARDAMIQLFAQAEAQKARHEKGQ
jgi:hypothetical protein